MSIRAINWAIELGEREDVTPTMRHILLVLANYASEDDIAYPRQTTIARITGLKRPTVCNNLGYLEEVGLITATGRTHATGATRSSEYKLHIPNAAKIDPEDTRGVTQDDTGGVTQDDRGVTQDDSGCQPGLQGGVTDDDTFNHHLEPSPEPSQEPRRKRRSTTWPDDYRQQFYGLYPKKVDRKDTFKKLDKIFDEDKVEFETIMAGLRRYIASVADQERRFIMGPCVFLNGERWDDEFEVIRRSPPPRKGFAI